MIVQPQQHTLHTHRDVNVLLISLQNADICHLV